MKVLLLILIGATTLLFSNAAQAYDNDCMQACTTTITADSGVSAKVCKDTGATNCLCSRIAGSSCYQIVRPGLLCPSGHVNEGWTTYNFRCCVDYNGACLSGGSNPNAEIETSVKGSAEMEEIFAPGFVDIYYGYAGTALRSPNAGRATSIKARLDVCVGDLDTDAAIATNNATTCYNQYCGASYNEYCKATGTDGSWSGAGAVCHDRCECAINGVTHSTCNQL